MIFGSGVITHVRLFAGEGQEIHVVSGQPQGTGRGRRLYVTPAQVCSLQHRQPVGVPC